MFSRAHDLARSLADESPVVIMARGHSGTRVLAWAIQMLGFQLGARQDVTTGDVQDRRFSRNIKKIARATLALPPTSEPNGRLLRSFHRSLAKYRCWLGPATEGWGWKFLETYLIPNYVAATFPNARYIHMVRDGRDVAFKDHLTDDPQRRLGYRLLRHLNALDHPHHVQAALSWEFQVRRYDNYIERTRPNVHTITFESLCLDPVPTMQGVCKFLGRAMTPECQHYLTTNVDAGKIAQYRREDTTLVSEVEAAAAVTLDRYGYSRRAA